MTTNEAIIILRRYSDTRNHRDLRPWALSWPECVSGALPDAVDTILAHLGKNTPVADCGACRHSDYEACRRGFAYCRLDERGECKRFEARNQALPRKITMAQPELPGMME